MADRFTDFHGFCFVYRMSVEEGLVREWVNAWMGGCEIPDRRYESNFAFCILIFDFFPLSVTLFSGDKEGDKSIDSFVLRRRQICSGKARRTELPLRVAIIL